MTLAPGRAARREERVAEHEDAPRRHVCISQIKTLSGNKDADKADKRHVCATLMRHQKSDSDWNGSLWREARVSSLACYLVIVNLPALLLSQARFNDSESIPGCQITESQQWDNTMAKHITARGCASCSGRLHTGTFDDIDGSRRSSAVHLSALL